ncbi:MAG: response regulator, partial [Alphaproteobacteria bacterium]|nr:response regulator [Alphaproteobacteria bacterium]
MQKVEKHILIVDDDTRLRSLLQRYLREQGFAVSAAKDAASAESLLGFYKVDIMVVDVMMPNMSGTEFLAKLRKEDNHTPVILLTAMGDAADRINGLEIGADDYVAKPFEPKELVLRINNILKRTIKIKEQSSKLFFGEMYYDLDKG